MLHITIYNNFEELYDTPEYSGNDYWFEEIDAKANTFVSSAIEQNKVVVIYVEEE